MLANWHIRVVLDNPSTHGSAALYQPFPPAEARGDLKRLEFDYTPEHASWLNMVEIETGVLRGLIGRFPITIPLSMETYLVYSFS